MQICVHHPGLLEVDILPAEAENSCCDHDDKKSSKNTVTDSIRHSILEDPSTDEDEHDNDTKESNDNGKNSPEGPFELPPVKKLELHLNFLVASDTNNFLVLSNVRGELLEEALLMAEEIALTQ